MIGNGTENLACLIGRKIRRALKQPSPVRKRDVNRTNGFRGP